MRVKNKNKPRFKIGAMVLTSRFGFTEGEGKVLDRHFLKFSGVYEYRIQFKVGIVTCSQFELTTWDELAARTLSR